MPPRRIAVLADSDTRWKWGASVARQIAPEHALDAYFLRGRSTPTERQLAEIGIEPDTRRELPTAALVDDPELAEADIVVMAVSGGTVLALTHSLGLAWAGREHRPITVTGYVGVVYEKMIDGLLTRGGSDIVLANSAYDARRFGAAFASVGIDPESVVECALPFLGGEPYQPSTDRPFTLTFAVQPSVPRSKQDRLRLLERAAAHARRHPDRLVLMKLRSLPGEHTTHVEADPYQLLVQNLAEPAPANLQLVYGNMGEVLDRTDLLVTVSSTAALESMQRGIPTAILTDFGVREAHGNHYFIHSGCLASWDELDSRRPAVARPRLGGRAGHRQERPLRRHPRPRDRAARCGTAADPAPLLHPSARSKIYLSGLLTRNGFDEKGRPLTDPLGAADSGRVKKAVRRVARRGAKAVYRVGYQRVAPTLRKWGAV